MSDWGKGWGWGKGYKNSLWGRPRRSVVQDACPRVSGLGPGRVWSARLVSGTRIRVVRLDGTALGHDSLLPHPTLSGGLERPTSRSLCTSPHPRFTLYSCPPRTSPSGSRPGTGCQRAGAQVPTTRQDSGGLQRRPLRKRAVAALGHPAFQLGTSPLS